MLAVANDSEILYQDMRRSAARTILLRLQAQSQQAAARQTQAGKQAASSAGNDTGVALEPAMDSAN